MAEANLSHPLTVQALARSSASVRIKIWCLCLVSVLLPVGWPSEISLYLNIMGRRQRWLVEVGVPVVGPEELRVHRVSERRLSCLSCHPSPSHLAVLLATIQSLCEAESAQGFTLPIASRWSIVTAIKENRKFTQPEAAISHALG